MNTPIKILHVFGILNQGGAETMIMNLYRNIDRENFQFDFVVHTDKTGIYEAEIDSLGGKIFRCPKYSVKNHFEYLKWWNQFFIKHPEYQILHSHIRSTASLYFPIAHKYGLKTIMHSHSISNGKGISSLVKKILQYPLRHQSDYFLACSKSAAVWLFGKNVLKKENFTIINNAIKVEDFKFDNLVRKNIRNEFGISDKITVFGHVGRFHEAKNHRFLIEFFNKIHAINPNTVLLLVGTGNLQESIIKKVNELSLQNSVVFLGNRSDVSAILQAMDIFLFPSKWEGLGMAVIEAQASGLHCLISNNLPDDVILSNLVEKVPNFDLDTWIDKVLSINLERIDVSREIYKNGYDISFTVDLLSGVYKRLNDNY